MHRFDNWRFELVKRAIVLMSLTLLVLAGCASGRTPATTGANAQQPVAENSLGRDIYVRTCAACHGPDGEGYANQYKAPALGPTEHAWHHPDGQIQRLIRDGGAVMPALGDQLSPEEIVAVITYLHTLWTPEQLERQQASSASDPLQRP